MINTEVFIFCNIARQAYLAVGLLAPGDIGGDEKESRSTRLYLPDLTWRAASLSSNGAPTLDLYSNTQAVSQCTGL